MKRSIIAVFTIAIVLFVSAAAFSKEAKVDVVQVIGKAEFQSEKDTWARLEKDMQLNPGVTVKTGANGEVILNWIHGNTVKVSPLSVFKMNDLQVDSAEGKDVHDLNLETGRVYIKANKAMKPMTSGSSIFTVKTPTSRAGVRGTEFTVQHDAAANASTFIVVEGALEVMAMDVSQLLDVGFQVEVPQNAPPGEIQSVPPETMSELKKESESIRKAEQAAAKEKAEAAEKKKAAEKQVSDFLMQQTIENAMNDFINENVMNPLEGCCDY